jgi:hypothetical protein
VFLPGGSKVFYWGEGKQSSFLNGALVKLAKILRIITANS